MTTTFINAADAKNEFSELINRVVNNKERIVITRRDKNVAAIVPLEDLQLIEAAQDKNDLEEAVEALKEARNQGTVTLDDLRDKIG